MANELIQARIRTRLGNIVVRRVRPDNPNIVEVVTARARTVAAKPKPAKPDPVKPAEPKVVRTDWIVAPHHGCCGGRVLIPVDRFETDKRVDEEALRRLWEAGMYGKRQVEAYEGNLQKAEAGLKYLLDNKRNMPVWAYYRQSDFEGVITSYKNHIKLYSWEECLKRGAVYSLDANNFKDPAEKQLGVTVSLREFPGSHQSPAGLWMRSDKEPGNSNPMMLSDVAKAVAQPDKITCHSYVRHVERYDPNPRYPTRHHILAGMSNRLHQASLNWAKIKQHVEGGTIKVGDLVTFILNHGQNDPKTDESLAAAGFQCVLVTGNSAHGNGSVLYLYERRITERDVELLNGK